MGHPEGAPPVREAARPEAERLLVTLRALVHPGASEDGFPWALAHGLLAFGPEHKTSEGRLAVEAIAEHARKATIDGREVYGFPPRTDAGLPIEPHRDMIVRVFLASGVPLDRSFRTSAGDMITLAQLVEDAEWAYELPRSSKDWHRFAWSAGTFFDTHSAMAQLNTHSGDVAIQALATAAVRKLEAEQGFLERLMQRGRPDEVRKRKQKIFAHTCGGLHFVQAAIQGAQHLRDPDLLTRAKRQLDVVKFRWHAERAIYRKTINENPKYAPLLLVQELKFFGHTLETFALAAKWGAITVTLDDKRFFQRVVADLARSVKQLKPIYAARKALRRATPQTYNDLIGDGCHAIRALELGQPFFF